MGTEGKLYKLTINGQEIDCTTESSFDFDFEPILSDTKIKNMSFEPIEFEIKFSWWQMFKLKWFMFKLKYFSREYIYRISLKGE